MNMLPFLPHLNKDDYGTIRSCVSTPEQIWNETNTGAFAIKGLTPLAEVRKWLLRAIEESSVEEWVNRRRRLLEKLDKIANNLN